MEFKGMDKLRAHLPELNQPAGQRWIGLKFLFFFTITTIYFIITDRAIEGWSIDSQILVLMIGFLVISQFFSKKKAYQSRYKGLAYSKAAIRFVLPGLGIILAAVAHAAYMNGPRIPEGWWSAVFTWLGWLMLLVGFPLWLRAVFTFGADNLALLYVYYPGEGHLVNSSIYSILRHPLYAAVLRLGIGLALLNQNAFSLTFALFMPLGMTGWIRLVEERDLIERFGQAYIDYRKKVPAFWPKPNQLAAFFKFIIAGG